MQVRTLFLLAVATVWIGSSIGGGGTAAAEDSEPALPHQRWSFTGPLGRFDEAQLRRGFLVYMEGCASCHGMRHIAYRDLSALGIGFGPEDIKALAAGFTVEDGPDEEGGMYERPARASDRMVAPYPNVEAARLANNGIAPPDLSLITKARQGGSDYVYAFLTGYVDPLEHAEIAPGMEYNFYAPGQQTGMIPSLFDDLVEYEDGTEASVDQMAKDVTAFLSWAADPHMEQRKKLGIKVVVFLLLLTTMLYALKREVWAHLHGNRPSEPAPHDPVTEDGAPTRPSP